MNDRIGGNVSYEYSLRIETIDSFLREYGLSMDEREFTMHEWAHDINAPAGPLAVYVREQCPQMADYSDRRLECYLVRMFAQQEGRYLKTESSRRSRAVHLTDPGHNAVDKTPSPLREKLEWAMAATREMEQKVQRQAREREAQGPRHSYSRGCSR